MTIEYSDPRELELWVRETYHAVYQQSLHTVTAAHDGF